MRVKSAERLKRQMDFHRRRQMPPVREPVQKIPNVKYFLRKSYKKI